MNREKRQLFSDNVEKFFAHLLRLLLTALTLVLIPFFNVKVKSVLVHGHFKEKNCIGNFSKAVVGKEDGREREEKQSTTTIRRRVFLNESSSCAFVFRTFIRIRNK